MPCPFLPYAERQKATEKRPTKKTTNHAAEIEHVPERPESTITEADVQEDDEETLPTFSPIQLEQASHYFEEQANIEDPTVDNNGDTEQIRDVDNHKRMLNSNLLSSTTTIVLDRNKNRIMSFRVNRLYENVQEELEIRQRNRRITV